MRFPSILKPKEKYEASAQFFMNEKQKAQGQNLVLLSSRTPGTNRYRCFLSDLAGLAVLPPPGYKET